jgi:hypothetical protein
MNYRIEKDTMGEVQVPAEVYWGAWPGTYEIFVQETTIDGCGNIAKDRPTNIDARFF